MTNKTEFTKEVAQLIENQFPAIYREEGAELVAFLKAYYEFIETNDKYSHKLTRQMFDMRDIDTSLDDFLVSFKETYLAGFPFKFKTDTKFAIKNIINYYRSKGSKESLSLLMKLLFDEDIEVYFPGEDVLRLSDSDWYKPSYLEVTKSVRTQSYLNQEISGAKSGAKAFVESIVRKRVKGKVFDVLYLSKVRGSFRAGEKITDDGRIAKAPKVKGSLTQVEVTLGGRNNSIGDVFNVVTSEGVKGKVKVTEVINATGRVDFEIVDPGWGYTTDGNTNIYVSDAILFLENENEEFIDFEQVSQPVQKVYTSSSADITSLPNLIGGHLSGYTLSSSLVANGTIIAVSNTFMDEETNEPYITANASANAVFTILPEFGTFVDQRALTLSSNNIGYQVEEIIAEESTVELTVTNLIGTFVANEKITQKTYESYGSFVNGITGTLVGGTRIVTVSDTSSIIPGQPLTKTGGTGEFRPGVIVASIISSTQLMLNKFPLTAGAITFDAAPFNVLTNYAFGKFDSYDANTNVVIIDESWGSFNTDTIIQGATASALPTDVYMENSNIGARGKLTSYTPGSNTIVVESIYGSYDVSKKIRGEKTGKIYTVNLNEQSGAVIVYANSNNSANGIISDATVNDVTGMVIGQNTTSVGIYGNTAPFYYSNTYPSYIFTDRSQLISPPRYANNTIIELEKQIERIPGGRNANFEIGVIGNIDPGITMYTDIIGATNVAGVPYRRIRLNGEGSGYGFVQDVLINSGGTGYSNGDTIAFTAGGFAGGDPTVESSAFVTTDALGALVDVTVNVPGAGYYEAPLITLPGNGGGDDADVEVVMNFGYGFPKNPHAEYYNLIGDVLNSTIADVGSIEILSRINPGQEYTADPFVRVYNPYVVSYQRSDVVLEVVNVVGGSFTVGEELVQIINNTESFKGIIKSTNIIGGTGQIVLKRQTVGIAFADGISVKGNSSGTTATVLFTYRDAESKYIGDNSTVTGTVISANGVATKVEVVDSGYGYINDDEVELEYVQSGNPFIITAITQAKSQGTSEGYWRSTNSHLNSEKKIHDNKYYQEYSYDVLSGMSLNKYEAILKRVFHVSGTRMFGSVVKTSELVIDVNASSEITKYAKTTAQLVDNNGNPYTTAAGSYLNTTTEVEI